jgi:hypothetical protein
MKFQNFGGNKNNPQNKLCIKIISYYLMEIKLNLQRKYRDKMINGVKTMKKQVHKTKLVLLIFIKIKKAILPIMEVKYGKQFIKKIAFLTKLIIKD